MQKLICPHTHENCNEPNPRCNTTCYKEYQSSKINKGVVDLIQDRVGIILTDEFIQELKKELLHEPHLNQTTMSKSIIVYNDKSWKEVDSNESWEYENDPDYFTTITPPASHPVQGIKSAEEVLKRSIKEHCEDREQLMARFEEWKKYDLYKAITAAMHSFRNQQQPVCEYCEGKGYYINEEHKRYPEYQQKLDCYHCAPTNSNQQSVAVDDRDDLFPTSAVIKAIGRGFEAGDTHCESGGKSADKVAATNYILKDLQNEYSLLQNKSAAVDPVVILQKHIGHLKIFRSNTTSQEARDLLAGIKDAMHEYSLLQNKSEAKEGVEPIQTPHFDSKKTTADKIREATNKEIVTGPLPSPLPAESKGQTQFKKICITHVRTVFGLYMDEEISLSKAAELLNELASGKRSHDDFDSHVKEIREESKNQDNS